MRAALFALVVPCMVASAQPTAMRFTECSADVGCVHQLSFSDYPGELFRMVGGLTVGDFNADGWPDVFALGGGGAADSLLINVGGAFEDQSEAWGLAGLHRGASASVGDVNADGLVDLFVVGYGDLAAGPSVLGSKLYLNRGGWFEDVAAAASVQRICNVVDGMSSVFADVDLDGDLDLFVCSWITAAQKNRLFINTGVDANGIPSFVDATPSMGVDISRSNGFTPRFADLNGDLYPELLLTADFGTCRLLVNRGPGEDGLPRFEEVTDAAGVVNDTNGMGSAIGDIDNDGDLDWFITNIYNAISGTTNTLYLNTGLNEALDAPDFRQSATAAGVHNAGWGWGTVLGDYDHDGDLDLAATGGWFTYPLTPARLYENLGVSDGLPRFRDVASTARFNYSGLGRTLATLDYDRDGDLDLVMASSSSPIRLFRNDVAAASHAVMFDLDTTLHPCLPPNGRHARIEIDAGGSTQMRVLDGGPTFLGQSEMVVHFGIGAADHVDEIRVLWPDGTRQRFGSVPSGTRTTLTARHPADMNHDGAFDIADVPPFLAAFSAGTSDADLDGNGRHELGDVVRFLNALGNPCPSRTR